MGSFQRPRKPAFAAELKPDIVHGHSHEYRNPTQLRDGGVLVVGAGNSGADIALDVADGHPTWLSGRDVGHVRAASTAWRHGCCFAWYSDSFSTEC